jgi:protein TonB
VSSVSTHPATDFAATERRAHQRRRLDQLAYIGFGPDTGGVLLDISEGGLRCQIVGAVVEGDRCHLKFALPGRHSAIEADGQVVWSNHSRQGGGVRLVDLGQDARQELHQWILEDLASNGARRPPAPKPAKSVGAVHVPPPSATEFVIPGPVANLPAAQLAVDSPVEPSISIDLRTAAEPPEPQAVADAALLAEATPPSATTTELESPTAKKTPVAKLPSAPPATRPGATPRVAARRLPIFVSGVQSRNPLLSKASLLAGGIAIGIAAVAFSGFNPASLFSTGTQAAGIVAPVVRVPVPPDMTTMTSQAPSEHPATDAKPAMASDPTDHPSQNAPQKPAPASRPETVAASAAPVDRPTQNAVNTQPKNRPPLALVPPRPRAATSAAPAVAVPEASLAPSLPGPLIDMPILDSRAAELPQPVGPPAASSYRPPQVLSSVQPVYSAYARQTRLQGTVRVNATVGADGIPHSLVCVSGNTALCQMAFEAITRWRYQPAMSNGKPVEAQTLLSFNFQLR